MTGAVKTGLSADLKILDKDSDGQLDLKELDDYVTKNDVPSGVLSRTIFKLIDEDQDGRVSAKELKQANKPKSTGHSEL